MGVGGVDLFSTFMTREEGFVREDRFTADMMSMTRDLATELFDSFTHHLSVCGVERRNNKLKECRRYT